MRWILFTCAFALTACGDTHEPGPTDTDGGGITPVDAGVRSSLGVGDTCRPLGVPTTDEDGDGRADGYSSAESNIELGTLMCRVDGCLVFRLEGDPRTPCNAMTTECADPSEAMRRVYCSCRCGGAPPGTAVCTCPTGFVCRPLPELSASVGAGNYCLREDTPE